MQKRNRRIRSAAFLSILIALLSLTACVTPQTENQAANTKAENQIPLIKTFHSLWSMPGSFDRVNHAVIIEDTLYLAGAARGLQAINPQNGQTRWKHIGKRIVDHPPILHNGILYLVEGGQFVTLNAREGEELTRVRTRVGCVSPLFPGLSTWMVAGGDGYVYGVQPKTGARAWHARTHGVVNFTTWDKKDLVFVATDNTLYGASIGTRKVTWSHPFPRQGTGAPSLADGIIYIGSSDFFLYAIDAGGGMVRWRLSLSAPVMGKALAAHGRVYVATTENILHAVDIKTQSTLWTIPANEVITATSTRVVYLRHTPAGYILGVADAANGNILGELAAGRYETFVAKPETGIFYAISPHGDILAIAEKSAGIIDH